MEWIVLLVLSGVLIKWITKGESHILRKSNKTYVEQIDILEKKVIRYESDIKGYSVVLAKFEKEFGERDTLKMLKSVEDQIINGDIGDTEL